MHIGLRAISPFNCCFTTNDFDDAIVDIEMLLTDVSKDAYTSIPAAELEQKILKLEQGYSLAMRCLAELGNKKSDFQLTSLIADILSTYGRLNFETDVFAAKQILLASLSYHLYAIGLTDQGVDLEPFSSLKDLKEQCSTKAYLFDSIEHLAETTDPNSCLVAALKETFIQPFSQKRLMNFAQTLRWLGHSYQHLDTHKNISIKHEQLFANLFHASEGLFLLIDSPAVKEQLADLYYEAWPFMHQRLHPQDAAGIYNLYNKALALNASPEMQARVANKRFLTLFLANQHDEAVKQIKKAIALAETVDDTESNRFLLANLYFNYACALLNPKYFDIEQAEIHFNRASRFATQSRDKGRDHIHFAIYDMRIAEFRLAKGELDAAKSAANRAYNTLNKFPHNQQPHILKAEALLSLINKIYRR